jgi:hypothetical protein
MNDCGVEVLCGFAVPGVLARTIRFVCRVSRKAAKDREDAEKTLGYAGTSGFGK